MIANGKMKARREKDDSKYTAKEQRGKQGRQVFLLIVIPKQRPVNH